MRCSRPLAAIALSLLAVLAAGCGSGAGETGQRRTADSAALPLPAKPDLDGEVTSPKLSPVWLIDSTGTQESEISDPFIAQGAFLVGDDVAVYYARSTVFGVRLSDSKEIWRTPVDMQSGEIVAAGRRTSPVTDPKEPWSYVFEDGDGSDHLVTLLPQTGKVIGTKDLGIGGVDVMATSGHTDVYTNDKGVWAIAENGTVSQVVPASAFGKGYQTAWALATVPGSSILVANLNQSSRSSRPTVAGLDVRNHRALWVKPVTDYFSGPQARNPGSEVNDGRLFTAQTHSGEDMGLLVKVLDPATGEVVRSTQLKLSNYYASDHFPYLGYNVNIDASNPYSVLPVGREDVIVGDAHKVSRLDPGTGEYRWTTDLSKLELRGGDASTATIGMGPTTPDGKTFLAFFSDRTSGDLLAIDTATGKVRGRWAIDDQLAAGLLIHPLMAYADGHVLLARNRADQNDLVEGASRPAPGTLKDLAWFEFPKEK